MLFLILWIAECLILYHFSYSDDLASLKSADKSINLLLGRRWLEIFWHSPLGKAEKIRSICFKYFLLNFVILGRFLLNDLSKYEIFLPIEELPHKYLILTFL